MGIFDIFGTGDQQAAANDQIAGLNAGFNQASGYLNQGIGALSGNYGSAINTLGQNFGAGSNALTSNYGAGNSALTGYGANANNAISTNYGAALQPFLQNYNTAQSGVTALGNVLGLNGAAGNQSALTQLQNTPGYQFQLQQGNNSINAAAAANGTLASGNQLTALSNYNQGLASTTYNNYVNQLQPYLNQSNTAAAGIGGVYTGLGNALSNNNMNIGGALNSNATGLGNALANNSANLGTTQAGVQTGLGNQLAGQYGNLGQLAYSTQTGIGNANANKDLAGLTASGNILNAGMQAATAAASFFSDERLKEDIEPVGELYDGQPVYKYRYIGDPRWQIGLMAQDVEQTNPDAVTEILGFKAVNYDKATRYAADLSKFVDGAADNVSNVVAFPPKAAEKSGNYATDLSRFLEAA